MNSPDKLSMILQSSDYERMHGALVIASAALAAGKRVTLFFTMSATHILRPNWADPAYDTILATKGVAGIESLLDACIDLNATFMVCETGLRVAGLTTANLRDDINITEGSTVSFIADASETGAILYI
ncbi:MAG: DsrE family protein [Pseudomonadota bacterium]|nr:DsrE family protein [Pseudomonadota bacterium]